MTSWLLPGATVPLGAVGHFDGVEDQAEGRDLVQEDLRGDSEGRVRDDVVEDEGIDAIVGGRGRRANGPGAVRGKGSADGDITGVVVVDAAADNEISGEEWYVEAVEALCEGRDAGGEKGKRERGGSVYERATAEITIAGKLLHDCSCT